MTEQQFQFNFPSDQNFTNVKEGPSRLTGGSGHSPFTCEGHQGSSQSIGPDPSLGFCRKCRVPGSLQGVQLYVQNVPGKQAIRSPPPPAISSYESLEHLWVISAWIQFPGQHRTPRTYCLPPSHVTCYCLITARTGLFHCGNWDRH